MVTSSYLATPTVFIGIKQTLPIVLEVGLNVFEPAV